MRAVCPAARLTSLCVLCLQESADRVPSVGSGPASVLMSPIPAVRRVYVTYSRPSPRSEYRAHRAARR